MRTKKFSNEFRERYKYSQAYRKEGWVDKQVKRGRMSVKLADTLKMIMPALEIVYPNNYDIQFILEHETFTHRNQYSLVEFDMDQYEYALYYEGRRGENGLRISLNDEEFEERMERDRYTRLSYLRECLPYTVDIDYIVVKRFKFHSFKVLIHFPEVTLRNSLNQSITIRDLFFRFSFDVGGNMNENIEGTKSTFTTDEFEGGYIHSHIPSFSMYDWTMNDLMLKSRITFQKVCLGAGEMKVMIADFKDEPDVEGFQMILHMLKTVASWESIEGVPHARMENITSKQIGAPVLHWHHADAIWKRVAAMRRLADEPLDWYYANGQYNIVDNEKLEDFCLAIYRYENMPFEYLVHKDETGAYYVPNRVTPTDMEPGPNDYIVFRGNKMLLKVEGELRLSGERKKYINPNIKNYVKRKLETAANQIQIKADTISRLHKINNNQGVSRQSEIPV